MLVAVLRRSFYRLLKRRDGAIAVLTALSLPFLLGMTGLAVEFGNGLMTKVVNQRIADAAAFAGAEAYGTSKSLASIQPAAARVAALNGLPASSVVATLGLSPRGTGNPAVQATITTSVPLVFSQILGSKASLSVPAGASVEMSNQASGCIYALDGTLPGITLSGSSLVTAALCNVATNASIAAPCNTSLSGVNVSYNTAVPAQPCGTIHVGASGVGMLLKKVVSDPLAANVGVQGIQARGLLVSAVVLPPLGSTASGGGRIDFGTNVTSAATKAQATALHCTASLSGTTWTLDACPAAGLTLTGLTLQNGYKLIFAPTGTANALYTFRNSLDASSGGIAAGISFGPGNYHFAGDLTNGGTAVSSFGTSSITVDGTLATSGSGSLTFGIGPIVARQGIVHASSGALSFGGGVFSIGQVPLAYACEPILLVSNYYSICATSGRLTIGGPSDISLTSGLYVAKNVQTSLGASTSNSYRLGRSTSGNGLKILAGASVSFADAIGSASRFETSGSVNFAGGAASCLILPAALQHDIAGNFDAGGGVIFGAGVYTVGGYFAVGNTSHVAGQCNGRAVTVEGTGVTFAETSGLQSPLVGACALQSFCIAGFTNASLKAPTQGTNANLLLVGPLTQVHLGALLSGVGSDLNLSGVIYYPHGPVSMSGGSAGGTGVPAASDCLMTVASQLNVTGGSLAAAPCNTGSTSPPALTLVQ